MDLMEKHDISYTYRYITVGFGGKTQLLVLLVSVHVVGLSGIEKY